MTKQLVLKLFIYVLFNLSEAETKITIYTRIVNVEAKIRIIIKRKRSISIA